MSLTINTNISSLIAQRSLNNATNSLNLSMERLTTGYKINHASDNAAGYSISKMWVTQLGSLDIVSDNAATGADMLTTAEDTYGLLTSHLQRVRDLTEQAANGTYGSQSLKAIQSEIAARLEEVNRISANAEFNGIKLMAYTQNGDGSGITSAGLNLQVGLYANADSRINLAVDLFKNASISGLFKGYLTSPTSESGKTLTQLVNGAGGTASSLNTSIEAFAAACSGLKYDSATNTFTLQSDADLQAKEMLNFLDLAINEISDRVTKIGAAQNRITSAISALDVQSQNLTSSLSTLRDTDVAQESSNFIQAQILQQASATLLATANQLPSVAINLI
jgi:Flagellin and related hook-associated proteins